MIRPHLGSLAPQSPLACARPSPTSINTTAAPFSETSGSFPLAPPRGGPSGAGGSGSGNGGSLRGSGMGSGRRSRQARRPSASVLKSAGPALVVRRWYRKVCGRGGGEGDMGGGAAVVQEGLWEG